MIGFEFQLYLGPKLFLLSLILSVAGSHYYMYDDRSMHKLDCEVRVKKNKKRTRLQYRPQVFSPRQAGIDAIGITC